MNYVFLKNKIYDNNQLLEVSCIKMDNRFKMIGKHETKINLNDKIEINKLKQFVKGSIVIGYDLSDFLIILLTCMYHLKIYDFSFRYFDIKDWLNTKEPSTIHDMIKLMRKYSNNNLDNIKYVKNNVVTFRIFRGLDYKLYLLDKGYYIYDKSLDKRANFYVHKKELAKDWDYTEEEYLFLKDNGAHFITNIFHISDETIKYTHEYTIYSDHNLDKYKYMIDDMNKVLNFLDKHPDLNIQLVCIGNIDRLKENYKILGKEKIEKIISLITKEKELWSKW